MHNGYVYETFGISKHLPFKLQLLLIRVEAFDNPLTAKCFIYDVVCRLSSHCHFNLICIEFSGKNNFSITLAIQVIQFEDEMLIWINNKSSLSSFTLSQVLPSKDLYLFDKSTLASINSFNDLHFRMVSSRLNISS